MRRAGTVVLAKPALPSVKFVMTAPMSLSERNTPSLPFVSCWLVAFAVGLKYYASDGLAALYWVFNRVCAKLNRSLKL